MQVLIYNIFEDLSSSLAFILKKLRFSLEFSLHFL